MIWIEGNKMRVLVVEDDEQILYAIVNALAEAGYEVDDVANGNDGVWMVTEQSYDMVLLDIMLPDIDGLEITKRIRATSPQTPVILVTARDSVDDRVRGLDVGADDYVVKPFAIVELLARMRAVWRRLGVLGDEGIIQYHDLWLNTTHHTASSGETIITLSSTEYAMLEFFMTNRERILTREQLFERVWGFDSEASDNVVDVYVHYLRKKLAAIGCGDYIVTQRGIGFSLKKEGN